MERRFDFTIIGSGIAGLFYALEVVSSKPNTRIAIVTKKSAEDSNTNRAQGGIAAVLSNTDSFEAHIADTLRTGSGLCNEEVVRKVVEAGPSVIQELIRYGVEFSTGAGGLDLTREGGHSAKRVVHAGDLTGREIERALLNACRSLKSNIEIYRNSIALDLLTYESGGENFCAGAAVLLEDQTNFTRFISPITMLATGGLCQVYLHNTNPPIATGDGVAMAHRAGATISNLEFVQFHPTALYTPGKSPFLISEAVRGEGARLRSVDGRYFMEEAHELKELAPRDVVARAIDYELKSTGAEYVLLDMTHRGAEYIKNRFPNIHATCLKHGFDMTKEPIPVVPSAHYACGGIEAGIDGETELTGLFAAGEVTMTGMHGANRLASNSLLEAVVVSKYAARRTVDIFEELPHPQDIQFENDPMPGVGGAGTDIDIKKERKRLTQKMSELVGIVRSEKRLVEAFKIISGINEQIEKIFVLSPLSYDLIELRNLTVVAELITKSALWRNESRGLHYMEDYPDMSRKFEKNSKIKKEIVRRSTLA
jgi:L-aspartate oxidase